jgi:ferric-dicitrate binding protein FerR (iron transport regulator)
VALVGVLLVPWLVTRSPGSAAIASTGIRHGDVAIMTPDAVGWTPLATGEAQTLGIGTRLRTGTDGQLALLLAAGMELRMNHTSEIQLAGGNVIDLTDGTIYLDSGPLENSGHVRIRTRFGELKDIGTQFEVSTRADGLRLRVREGRVLLQGAAGLRLESGAGQQLTVDAAGQLQRTAFRTDDPAWGWTEQLAGAPDVEGLTVSEFLTWVARQTGRRVQFAKPGIQLRARTVRLRSTASLAALTPIELLDTVLATTNFSYLIQEDGVILINQR